MATIGSNRRGFTPKVAKKFVPGTYINDNAGDIIGAAGRQVSAQIGSLAQATAQHERQKMAIERSDLTANFTDWSFQLEQELNDLETQSPPNEANYYDRAEETISNRSNEFLSKVDPRFQAELKPKMTLAANSFRRRAFDVDAKKKGEYFKGRTSDLVNAQAPVVANNPAKLQEAKTSLREYLSEVDMPESERFALLKNGEANLEAIAFDKNYEEELTRGKEYIRARAGRLVPQLLGIESSFKAPPVESVEKVQVVDNTGRKIRNQPVASDVDFRTRSAVALLGPEYGVVYESGGQPATGPRRTGSTRHDHGNSVDVVLTRNGEAVTPAQDPILYEQFLENAASMGFTGMGHYTWGVHVGMGKGAAWGPDTTSKTLDPRFGAAIERGRKKKTFTARTAKTSSASGPGQITDGTWARFMETQHPEIVARLGGMENTKHLREDIVFSSEAAEWYLNVVGSVLSDNQLPINDATLYLGYFLGEGDVVRALTAPSSAKAEGILSPASIKANKSILAGKTMQEIRDWAAKKVGQSTYRREVDSDLQYANLDYDRRLQIRSDVERRVASQKRAQASAEKQAAAEQLNAFLVGVKDGNVGLADYEAARKEWLTDYDDILKVDKAFKDQFKDIENIRGFGTMVEGNGAWNPNDKDHKKYVNAAGAVAAEPMIDSRHEQAATAIQKVIDQTQGSMAPADAIGKLSGLARSSNSADALYALAQLEQLQQANGPWIKSLFGAATNDMLDLYDPGQTAEANMAVLGIGEGNERRQTVTTLLGDARESIKQLETTDTLDPDQIIDRVFDGFFTSQPTIHRSKKAAFVRDWKDAYQTAYVRSQGNPEAAAKAADKKLERVWGITTINGSNEMMRHPPSSVPALSFVPESFLKQQVEADWKVAEGETFTLTADQQTERELKQNQEMEAKGLSERVQPVSYAVTVFNSEGMAVRGSTPNVRNSRQIFDTQAIKDWNEEDTRRAILRDNFYRNRSKMGFSLKDAPIPNQFLYGENIREREGDTTLGGLPAEYLPPEAPEYKKFQKEREKQFRKNFSLRQGDFSQAPISVQEDE